MSDHRPVFAQFTLRMDKYIDHKVEKQREKVKEETMDAYRRDEDAYSEDEFERDDASPSRSSSPPPASILRNRRSIDRQTEEDRNQDENASPR